jgi:heme/copper-type cytochrome/quinol oxidase subunit 3
MRHDTSGYAPAFPTPRGHDDPDCFRRTFSAAHRILCAGAHIHWFGIYDGTGCLGATIAFGLAFLILKGFEYHEDIEKHLVPGAGFALKPAGAQIFFALYWVMTATHAIHLTIGMGLIGRLTLLGYRGRLEIGENPEIEITALYWHLVDVI